MPKLKLNNCNIFLFISFGKKIEVTAFIDKHLLTYSYALRY